MNSIRGFRRRWLRSVLAIFVAACPLVSHAVVECNVTVLKYFVGDEGSLWVNWKEGGAGLITQGDPDFKATMVAVTAALLGNRQLTVRYNDGASCTGMPVPIVGMWLW